MRHHKLYKEKIRKMLRWVRTFEILQWNFCSREYLPKIHDNEVESPHLNQAQRKKVDNLLDQLDKLIEVALFLPSEKLTGSEVRANFG